jgi:hypothetical protein
MKTNHKLKKKTATIFENRPIGYEISFDSYGPTTWSSAATTSPSEGTKPSEV